jgi:peptidoglycan/xylan/chitin deacetylase (PgdA/CDA1 family)
LRIVLLFVVVIATGWLALAAASPGLGGTCRNPEALGTRRTLVIDPSEHVRLGTMQYRESLPLNHGEVVLTFDDGPLPPYSTRVLDILASECVKATYFLVGRMARAYPEVVARMHAEGHTIGTHTQNHPLTFHKISVAHAQREIDGGIASVRAALGGSAPAPFFRIPGLLRARAIEHHLAARGLMTWSADYPADDWKRISDKEVVRRVMQRLNAQGRGMLLLHDIQPATVLALPVLLRQLKARGYRIVHVVPARPGRPKTETLAGQWQWRYGPTPPAVASLDVSGVGAIPGLPVTARGNARDRLFGNRLVIPIQAAPWAGYARERESRRTRRVWSRTAVAPRRSGRTLPAPDRRVFTDQARTSPEVTRQRAYRSASQATGSVPWQSREANRPVSSGLLPALLTQLQGQR